MAERPTRKQQFQAVALAVDLARRPSLAAAMRLQPLPADTLTLIQIAAGAPDRSEELDAAFGHTPSALREAASLYLQEVMLHADADHYRVLGLRDDASDGELREHFRWLMKGLHPDANGQAWESVLANRVIAAWNALKTPERRADYDRQLAALREGERKTAEPRACSGRPPQNRPVRLTRVRNAPATLPPASKVKPNHRWVGGFAGLLVGLAIIFGLRLIAPL